MLNPSNTTGRHLKAVGCSPIRMEISLRVSPSSRRPSPLLAVWTVVTPGTGLKLEDFSPIRLAMAVEMAVRQVFPESTMAALATPSTSTGTWKR